MIGYKSKGNSGYVIVDVELDSEGAPILEPGVILEPPPETIHGEQPVINDGKWVIVPHIIDNPPETIEQVRQTRELQYDMWVEDFMSRPYIYDGYVFENSPTNKEQLSSAIRGMRDWDIVPEVWITADNKIITSPSKEFMNGLAKASFVDQEITRTVAFNIKGLISNEKDITKLKTLTFPSFKDVAELSREIDKK